MHSCFVTAVDRGVASKVVARFGQAKDADRGAGLRRDIANLRFGVAEPERRAKKNVVKDQQVKQCVRCHGIDQDGVTLLAQRWKSKPRHVIADCGSRVWVSGGLESGGLETRTTDF